MPENVATGNPSSHYFHAEAHALSGKLILPFEEQIKKQAFVKLLGDSKKLLLEGDEEEPIKLRERKAQENYLSQHSRNYRLEGIISYSAAHTQVSGHRSKKNPKAFVTLATSFVENLNVLNVVTADRVVAQISTTHLPDQYSPEVTFLGTHFENLRIARHKTVPILNLGVAGKAPKGTDTYYPTAATRATGLMASAERQYQKLRSDFKEVKEKLEQEYLKRLEDEESWFSKQYHKFSDFNYQDLQTSAKDAAEKSAKASNGNGSRWEGVTCSLVEHIEIPKDPEPIVIHPPAHCFGHVIHIPDFGTIFLAELTVNHNSFHLTMIRLELGCIADGSAKIVTCNVNGRGSGGH
ncbi:MAG TPA: hypothetical protein VMG82_24220 [Candidatus Sulfotelmatobacter sp.]|nr:hypothetical protein [Candidatus Sulfotelmatobacter sp.]